MIAKTSLFLGLLALSAESSYASVISRVEKPAFLSLPIERHTRQTQMIRRAASGATLFNISSDSFLIELSIGTPSQKVKVNLDTGSTELWVNPNCNDAKLTQNLKDECIFGGQFNTKGSSTFKALGTKGNVTYVSTSAAFTYSTDDVKLEGTSAALKALQFGVAFKTDGMESGVLGAAYGKKNNLSYSNFIDALQEQKITKYKAFSIGLGDKEDNNGGAVVFGGVNTKRFTGNLTQIKFVPSEQLGGAFDYDVSVSTVGVTAPGQRAGSGTQHTKLGLKATLDTGSPSNYFPKTLVEKIAKDMGAKFNKKTETYQIDCKAAEQNGTVDFTLGGFTVHVPYKDLIVGDQGDKCRLEFVPTEREGQDDIPLLLGAPFMHAFYFVFDQVTDSVWVADYRNCGKNEREIGENGVAAGNFVGECLVTDGTRDPTGKGGKSGGNSGGNTGGGGNSGGSSDKANGAISQSVVPIGLLGFVSLVWMIL